MTPAGSFLKCMAFVLVKAVPGRVGTLCIHIFIFCDIKDSSSSSNTCIVFILHKDSCILERE